MYKTNTRAQYGDVKDDINPIHITPNQISWKNHIIQSNYDWSNLENTQTVKANKPVKIKKME